jgi:hypothetical protein
VLRVTPITIFWLVTEHLRVRRTRTLRKTCHWSSTVPLAGKARTALLLKSQAMTGSPKPFILDDGQNPFMSWVDGTQINFNDGGTGQLVVFSHGWPLSADALRTRCSSWRPAATAASPATVVSWPTDPTLASRTSSNATETAGRSAQPSWNRR